MTGNKSLAYRYKEVDVNTANPLQLVVMLYEAAIFSLQRARFHISRKDIEGRSKALNHCNSVITELQSCLNMKEGGEIAVSLDRLYGYMKRRVFQANVDQSSAPLREIEGLLEYLCSAWRELASKSPDGSPMSVNRKTSYSNTGIPSQASSGQMRSLNISI